MPNTSRDANFSSSELIRVKPFASALSTQILGRAESLVGQSWAITFIEEGTIRIRTEDKETELLGPVVCALPWSDRNRMTIAPGAVGAYVNLGSTTLYNAIGYKAESAELRAMSRQEITLNLTGFPDMLGTIKSCFSAIYSEHQNQAAASRTVIEGYLRILLIQLWRQYDVTGTGDRPRSPMQEIYNRFNNLVEIHFRDRWSVIRYAQSLNVSRDRLGDICREEGKRSPKEIIDMRTVIEARLMLEHSTHSLEQISDLLGFASSAHFSRFFVRMTGTPPGRYRKDQIRNHSVNSNPASGAAYEWP